MAKITIIDGNSLLFRAYFATAYPGMEIMRTSDGTPTNAVFAFSNMINKIITDIKQGESLFVAFDAGKHNFRHDALETYKANRKPAPEDLVKQFPLVREYLKAMGIFQFEEEGFEGDDIAGTVAKLAAKNNYQVTVYTSDKDFLQLVDDKISVNLIKKGLSDVNIMTPSSVKETLGFEPLQIIDYKGLRGDTSDNLPGIPGIGEITAVKLIQEYGSFDNIIANADNIKGKIGEAIKLHGDIGRISRDLAVIKTDIELPFKLSDTQYEGYDFNTLNTFCQKYEFKQYISKVNKKWKKVDLANTNIEFQNVGNFENFVKPSNISIALDFEDEDYTNCEVYGMGIILDGNCYYITLDNLLNDNTLKSWLLDAKIQKYCYDFKAIKVALSKHNVEINGLVFDLMLATYLEDSSIKSTPQCVFSFHGIDIESGQDSLSLFSNENPLKTVKIAFFSYALSSKIIENLKDKMMFELFNDVEIPLCSVLAKMEIEGFPLDEKVLSEYGDQFKAKAEAIAKEIYEMVGEEFNLSSPKQIGEILFNKMGLKSNKKMSTSVDVLNELKNDHPVISKILEYRKYFKIVSTYTEGLKAHIHRDGKIHAKFNQSLTTTGRLSSSDPNLQNISVRDEEGKLIRKAFFYPEDNFEILSLDYSQIELRLLASLSDCKPLIEMFNSGEDVHSATARLVFNLSGDVDSSLRRKAKTVNFGIVYGISDFGLADELEIPIYEARDLIKNFYSKFPEIEDYFKKIVADASSVGYSSTLFGRRRYLPELNDANYQTREFAKRAAMNAPIQGTAADLIKKAMIEVDKRLEQEKLKTKMVLQIHDELIFKVPLDEKEKVLTVVKDVMEHALTLSVPLEVDGGFGKSWYETK